MGRPPKLKAYAIADPDPETLGPAMLACTLIGRRFARGFVAMGGENLAAIARASGYSDVSGGARARAQEALHNPKVVAAIREEARRTFDLKSVKAQHVLDKLLDSEDEKIRMSAAEKILDRTDFGPRSTQHQIIQHVDSRSTMELLEFVRSLTALKPAPPPIEGECTEVAGATPQSI